MKNLFTILFILILSATVSAQTTFWTENFGTGCNQGQMLSANGLTSNGTWTVSQTGENDDQANVWYISAKEDGTGAGNCSDHNCTHNNQSLHVGSNDGLSTNDAGCNYDAGGLCSIFSVCVVTNIRAESPVINCSGQSTITLAFNYMENGDGSNDNGTCWYYNGTSWALLVDMPKTTGCAAGQWTAYSIALPASANGNANVKIGFNWTNNDDGVGNDPSLGVDDITLSVPGGSVLPPVAKLSSSDTTFCSFNCIHFTDLSTNNPTSWLWTFKGALTGSSTAQNPSGICYDSVGDFTVILKVTNSGGTNSDTLSSFIHVIASPPVPTITQVGDTLYCSYDASYTSYQWYDSTALVPGATSSKYKISRSGNYNVAVTNLNNCAESDGILVTDTDVSVRNYSSDHPVSIYPSPAKSELTVTGNWQSASGLLSVYDMLGKKAKEYVVKLDKNSLIVDVKSLPEGIYFMQITNDRGRWIGKFIKD